MKDKKFNVQKRENEALIASETRYRRLFESSKDGIFILNAETGMIEDVNPYLMDLLGYTKKQFIDKAIWDIGSFKDRISNRENFLELQENDYIRYEDMPLQTAVGRLIHVEFVSNVYLVNNKKVIQCNIRDITDRKRVAEALEKKHTSYIANAPDGVFVIDEKGQYVDVNPASTKITGYSREELLKMDIKVITAPESLHAALKIFKTLVEKGFASDEVQYIHKDGSIRWWSVDAVQLSEKRYLGFARDTTDKKMAEESLIYYGYHDYLTDLYNRGFFEEEFKRLDTKQNLPLSVMMCDINGLKLVNDSFGHHAGDALIKKTAIAIKKGCRAKDIVARIGGDEFAVILPKTNADETMAIAERITAFAQKEKIHNVALSLSYGSGTKTSVKQSLAEALASAENKMYTHKLYARSSRQSKTIDLIMNALFEKSKRESIHSNRVSGICHAIASKMGLDENTVNRLGIAGLVHDIGKIGIDESILNKPGSLSADERKEIERHPEAGWRILSSTGEFSELAQSVLTHHEKWDGTGYPNGLKGEAIPIEARIIAVADAYDAMTGERSYKSKISPKAAMAVLKRCAGTQFDPAVVDAFVNRISPKEGDF